MMLVTTAGKVGSEAVRTLRRRGLPVRVLVRNRTTGEALAEVGTEIAEGDLEAPLTIDTAMAGIATVVLVSPAIPAQELNAIHSAVRAGVAHVVTIASDASADSPIARRRGQAGIEAGAGRRGVTLWLVVLAGAAGGHGGCRDYVAYLARIHARYARPPPIAQRRRRLTFQDRSGPTRRPNLFASRDEVSS